MEIRVSGSSFEEDFRRAVDRCVEAVMGVVGPAAPWYGSKNHRSWVKVDATVYGPSAKKQQGHPHDQACEQEARLHQGVGRILGLGGTTVTVYEEQGVKHAPRSFWRLARYELGAVDDQMGHDWYSVVVTEVRERSVFPDPFPNSDRCDLAWALASASLPLKIACQDLGRYNRGESAIQRMQCYVRGMGRIKNLMEGAKCHPWSQQALELRYAWARAVLQESPPSPTLQLECYAGTRISRLLAGRPVADARIGM